MKDKNEPKNEQHQKTEQKPTEAQKSDPQHKPSEATKSDQQKIQELTDTLQRLQADFENYKKRQEKERDIIARINQSKIIQQVLPILDTFELALKNTDKQEQFKKGVEMIYAQIISMLQSNGVKPIEAVGAKLDPHLHEVMLQEVKDNCKDDQILEELQKGYMMNSVIIRTSKVKIAKKK